MARQKANTHHGIESLVCSSRNRSYDWYTARVGGWFGTPTATYQEGHMTRIHRAKLPKIQVAIAQMECVFTYPVASCGETKIVASSPPGFPAKWEAAA
ncbi:MAG: hypothetical protein K0S10_342 [Rubrobacteraceae bacterium]|jgi:hypothetical protein|nr:hypothetical protein [Rubrobacteraceae bacterium]